ncbi:hypothetical protein [Desulfonema limicola]|uniref:hypothetical protein n=1 Tax=Desulfonema limicola TaxID=45656 RepID=UPI001A9C0E2F
MRGGGWVNNARRCRSAYRNNDTPDRRNDNNGFRLVLPPAHRIGRCRSTDPNGFPTLLPRAKMINHAGHGIRSRTARRSSRHGILSTCA